MIRFNIHQAGALVHKKQLIKQAKAKETQRIKRDKLADTLVGLACSCCINQGKTFTVTK